MANPRALMTIDGQEVALEDLNQVFTEAAHADDYVFAEMFRLKPGAGVGFTPARGILPYRSQGQILLPAIVASSGSGNGSVKVSPFRAAIGPRFLISATSTDAVLTTGAQMAWQDMRSAVFLGGPTALSQTVALTANSSGNPRIDLIYAKLCVDQAPATPANVFVKAPGTSQGTQTSLGTPLTTTLGTAATSYADAIGVAIGTPAAAPAVPSAPSDVSASGIYYIPIAAVVVPNGFTTTSTVSNASVAVLAGTLPINEALGVASIAPASYTSPSALLTQGSTSSWGAVGTRAPIAMPTSMVGGYTRPFSVDFSGDARSPIANGTVIDSSIDWSRRICRITVFAGDASAYSGFAWDSAVSTSLNTVPSVARATGLSTSDSLQETRVATSIRADMGLWAQSPVTGASMIYMLRYADWNALGSSGCEMGLYVLNSQLCLYTHGTISSGRIFFIVEALGQFDNY